MLAAFGVSLTLLSPVQRTGRGCRRLLGITAMRTPGWPSWRGSCVSTFSPWALLVALCSPRQGRVPTAC